MIDKLNLDLKLSLFEESKSYVLVDDSLLLKVLDPELDIFDMFSDFKGEPIGLATYILPGLPEQNIPFEKLYGVPKAKWD